MSEKRTYLYSVSYFGHKGTAEIEATSKQQADKKMKCLANAGCGPPSEYIYKGVQEEPAPFFFPDFRPIASTGSYKKRIK